MTNASAEKIDQLVAELNSKDGVKRSAARNALVQMGPATIPALLIALREGEHKRVRWEAAKSLVDIADPEAADGLIGALEDVDSDVRWVAGDALVALGRDGVKPLLKTLMGADVPGNVYKGAHHVLHELVKQDDLAGPLRPVLEAIDHWDPHVAVPRAADAALQDDRL
ncbi:MAG: HEAT repeat domain-containing protein [Planctomycetota bacterium]|jgi:HEAT repeat protein